MRYAHHVGVRLDNQIRSAIVSIARDRFGTELHKVELDSRSARGGLESSAVVRFRLRARDRQGRIRSLSLVAKYLDGSNIREVDVYRSLSRLDVRIAPSVFKVEPCPDCRTVLFMEDVRARSRWPWHDSIRSAAVLQQLADFHEVSRSRSVVLPPWDYEAVLHESALATLECVRRLRRQPEFGWLKRSLHSIDRIVLALASRRTELLAFGSFGSGPIHGDVHPGNVIERKCARGGEPVLIDWARARTGSALEDVSSWLQTLAYWEPEARRRHDTLLLSYLRARGYEARLSSELREVYWIAAASNALAGALRYYCFLAETSTAQAKRARAVHAARDWVRMIERAHALSAR